MTSKSEKPYKGIITDWTRMACPMGLGFYIVGQSKDHPIYGPTQPGHVFHTSWVVEHNKKTGEIETCNSRYTLSGKETKLKRGFAFFRPFTGKRKGKPA